MTDTKTAGQRLVALLDEGLPNGILWKASEKATLELISDTADRVEVLKKLLAAEVKSIECSSHRCAELAGEIRMAQTSIAKMISWLDPRDGHCGEVGQTSERGAHTMVRSWARWALEGVFRTESPRSASISSRNGTSSMRRM